MLALVVGHSYPLALVIRPDGVNSLALRHPNARYGLRAVLALSPAAERITRSHQLLSAELHVRPDHICLVCRNRTGDFVRGVFVIVQGSPLARVVFPDGRVFTVPGAAFFNDDRHGRTCDAGARPAHERITGLLRILQREVLRFNVIGFRVRVLARPVKTGALQALIFDFVVLCLPFCRKGQAWRECHLTARLYHVLTACRGPPLKGIALARGRRVVAQNDNSLALQVLGLILGNALHCRVVSARQVCDIPPHGGVFFRFHIDMVAAGVRQCHAASAIFDYFFQVLSGQFFTPLVFTIHAAVRDRYGRDLVTLVRREAHGSFFLGAIIVRLLGRIKAHLARIGTRRDLVLICLRPAIQPHHVSFIGPSPLYVLSRVRAVRLSRIRPAGDVLSYFRLRELRRFHTALLYSIGLVQLRAVHPAHHFDHA